MKKIISIFLVFAIIFVFAACTDEQPDASVSENGATQAVIADFGTTPTVYAIVSNENPAVGEEVTVTVKLCNAGLFSSIDLIAEYDSNALSVEYTGGCTISDIVDTVKIDAGKISYGGFVMRSAEVTDATLFELTITPQAGASGTQTIQINGINFLVALDTDGNATDDKTSQLQTNNIVLNIQ